MMKTKLQQWLLLYQEEVHISTKRITCQASVRSTSGCDRQYSARRCTRCCNEQRNLSDSARCHCNQRESKLRFDCQLVFGELLSSGQRWRTRRCRRDETRGGT